MIAFSSRFPWVKWLSEEAAVKLFFEQYTDYERSLSKMTLSELASELDRTQKSNEASNTIIVEHILASRLVRIQSNASWWSGWLNILGAMLAVLLSFYLGKLSANNPNKVEWTCHYQPEQGPEEKPTQAIMPNVKQESSEREIVNRRDKDSRGK